MSFPTILTDVLNLRATSSAVPPDIERTLKTLPVLLNIKTSSSSGQTRFKDIGYSPKPNAWRSQTSSVSEDGFITVGRKGRGAWSPSLHRVNTSSTSLASSTGSDTVDTPKSDIALFSSAAVKTADVGDRMLARIKGKINKIGNSTYDATKVFMQQILSGDETEFLDEILKFVFAKAATESIFCGLYARLLHELADEFTHIRVVIQRIFRSYLDIFSQVNEPTAIPDENTSEYKIFLEIQERKKFRRGYSQFVAEMVKLGEAPVDDFQLLLTTIVSTLEGLYSNVENTLLSEEYVDCLAKLCSSAPRILKNSTWAGDLHSRLVIMNKLGKTNTPGFSNKTRFALMDLVELGTRGWE